MIISHTYGNSNNYVIEVFLESFDLSFIKF